LPWNGIRRRPDRRVRAAAFASGTYANEWHFFSQVAPNLSMRLPRCWLAHYDQTRSEFLLVLEDLTDFAPGDQLRGLSCDQISCALEAAANLHARWWGAADLESLSPYQLTDDERAKHLSVMYRTSLRRFLNRVSALVEPDVVELARALGPRIARWTRGTSTPRALVHHDLRGDNLLFRQGRAAQDVAVVDWQTVRGGLAMADIAYLLGGSLTPAARAAQERSLIDRYLAMLEQRGVAYPAADGWRDYRFCSVWGLIMAVLAAGMATPGEPGDPLVAVMASRHGRHALDLDALSLLPEDDDAG